MSRVIAFTFWCQAQMRLDQQRSFEIPKMHERPLFPSFAVGCDSVSKYAEINPPLAVYSGEIALRRKIMSPIIAGGLLSLALLAVIFSALQISPLPFLFYLLLCHTSSFFLLLSFRSSFLLLLQQLFLPLTDRHDAANERVLLNRASLFSSHPPTRSPFIFKSHSLSQLHRLTV